jgi:hypothetical protein
MQGGQAERNIVLIKVVANRYFSAIGIPSAVQAYLVVIVVAGLYQNGNLEFSQIQGVNNTYFETEIGQGNQYSIDAVAVFPEKFGAFDAVFPGFDTAGGCLTFIENNVGVTGFGKAFQQRFSHVFGQGRVEIITGAYYDPETKLLFV